MAAATRVRTARSSKHRRSTSTPQGRVVALTGAFGFYGRRLIRLLEADPSVERIVAIDIRSPVELAARENESIDPAAYLSRHARLSAHQLDLTAPGADRELTTILRGEQANSLCHLAFLSNPTHARELAHELENIGTMYVLHAVRAANVTQLLTLSSTMCYGARHDNPAFLLESHALRGPQGSRFIKDKLDADLQTLRFAADNPRVRCTVARLGVVLGAGVRNFWARYLQRPAIPTVLGYDPLFQVLHSDDAVRGLYTLWRQAPVGAYHLVGKGVLPLSHIIHLLGRRRVPLPATMGGGLLSTLWNLQLAEMPPSFLEYLRWSWVCDGGKTRDEVGFVPLKSTRDVVATLQSEWNGAPASPTDDA